MQFASSTYSQRGQDGILSKLFDLLDIERGYCVEFGAWDGVKFSNTRALTESGWGGVLIETHAARFKELEALYQDRSDVITLNRAIDIGKNSLDSILSECNAPIDLDFVSIDIDGDDYHVWNSIQKFKPKVVLIESNPYFPPFIEFVQSYNSKHLPMGASALSTFLLGEKKGYRAVAYIGQDWLFVRDDLLPDLAFPSYFEMTIKGGVIRGGNKISIGDRKELESGVAGTGFVDLETELNALRHFFTPDEDSHFYIRSSRDELEELT